MEDKNLKFIHTLIDSYAKSRGNFWAQKFYIHWLCENEYPDIYKHIEEFLLTDIVSYPYFSLYKQAYNKIKAHGDKSETILDTLRKDIQTDLQEFLWPNAREHYCIEFDYAFKKETFLSLSKGELLDGLTIVIDECRKRKKIAAEALKNY